MNLYFYESKAGKNLILEYIDSLSLNEQIDGYSVLKCLEENRIDELKIKRWQKKVYEIFDESLQILKDYKKALKGPIVRNTPVRLKKGSTSKRGRPRKNSTEESKTASNNKPRKKYYKKKSSLNKNKKTENKPS